MNASPFLNWLLRTSWQASVLVVLVLAVQWLFRRRLNARWQYALWLLVLARLAMPAMPASSLSVFNVVHFAPRQTALQPTISSLSQSVESPPVAVRVAEDCPVTEKAAQPQIEPPATRTPKPTPSSSPVMFDKHRLARDAGMAWLAGLLLLGGRAIGQNFLFLRRLRTAKPVTDEATLALFDRCREMMGVPNLVRLAETEHVKSPALYGFFHPMLLLPLEVMGQFSLAEQRHIFLHELAHVKRRDMAVHWAATALRLLHWFNPLLWFGFQRMAADRELACDELALAAAGEKESRSYGETVLKLLEICARPAVLPGLMGILEEKSQMARRILRIARYKQQTHWPIFALLLLLALGLVTLTDAQSEKPKPEPAAAITADNTAKPDLIGEVHLANGHAAQATICVWTAEAKVGTSPFCPGCYADCNKSAKTDASGHFKIVSLDPQLKFRILAVGAGLTPKFVENVDPSKGPLSIGLDAQDLASSPPEQTLRGRVVDAKGAPIAAAAIQPRGIKTKDGDERWGTIKIVDPLAITDAQGRFVLTSREPFTRLGVWVEARGFAPNAFKKLVNDGQEHELVLTEGATLQGRVLYHGQPLANVTVATYRDDREIGDYPGHFEVGTDTNGRFRFLNLPPLVHYNISGELSTLQKYGSIPPTPATVGADGSTTDVGVLSVQPAYRISGRVVLSDGRNLPPKTRLVVNSDTAGSTVIDLGKDGHFATGGIGHGMALLRAEVPGYHWSLKNASFDELTPGALKGRVDHDITNLVLLMDKGPRLQSHFDGQADGGPQPEFNTLRGVEDGGSRLQQRQITGRLTDAASGQPISQFRVTPGRYGSMIMDLDWNPNLAVEGSNGNYAIDIDKHARVIELKFESEGYLPAATAPLTTEKDHCDFSLTKGTGPKGTVLLSDGQPAADAEVLLVCPAPRGEGLLCLRGNGKFQGPDRKELLVTTDAAGHFSFAPEFEMKAVAASGGTGFKMVPIESLQTNAKITLEPWGKIKGVLHRPSGPGTNQDLTLDFPGSPIGRDLVLDIPATTDDNGAFEFDHVPPGDCEISTIVSVGEDAADTERLQKVHVPPGQTVDVTIEAGPKPKLILLGRRGVSGSDFPPIKSTLHGIVLLPNGKPAADAQVAVKVPEQNLHVGDGELVAGPMNDSVVRTEADGSFAVPMRDSATALYALNDAGFAKVPTESWTNGVKIVLQPWGRVEGVWRLNHSPATNEKIELHEDREFGRQFTEGGFRCTTTTDEKGRFVFAHVPAGDLQLWRSIPCGNNGWMSTSPIYFSVRSGETTNLACGGKGCPVLGRCVVENQQDVPDDPTLVASIYQAASNAPAVKRNSIELTSERKEREKFKTRNGQSFVATAAADGSFRVDDVEPGTYQLEFTIRGAAQRLRDMTSLISQPIQIVVPPLSDSEKCEPFELGVLKTSFTIQENHFRKAQVNAHSLKAGDTAPPLETKALNGQSLKLQDYRGKFVLLDFRYMLPGAEMEGLQYVNTTFGADDRFAIISLCQTADEDFLKNMSAKGATHWIQGNLDLEAMGGPYGLNDATFPVIMLVDPNGKIVATELRGDDIQSTVAAVLAKK